MIESCKNVEEKKNVLRSLAEKAQKRTDDLSRPSNNSTLEQKMLEGKQGADERLVDELKTTVEGLTNAIESIDTRSRELENELQEQLLDMRETYATKAYRFVWLWSIALIVIIVLQGSKSPSVHLFFFEFKATEFNLDPKIIVALISGVTINIVAVFVVVIRNLFPSEAKISNSTKKSNK